jgi:hypothetical protein
VSLVFGEPSGFVHALISIFVPYSGTNLYQFEKRVNKLDPAFVEPPTPVSIMPDSMYVTGCVDMPVTSSAVAQ